MKILIIGGGYTSCCVARMLADLGHQPIIFEKENQLGGMARSFTKEGMTYEFGPHILANHASEQRVIDFILKYIEVIPTQMDSATFLQSKHLNYPPYFGDIPKLKESAQINLELEKLIHIKVDEANFESYLKSKVGATLYELYFKHFTEKFWMVDPSTLSANWAKLRHLGQSLTEKRMFFNQSWCAYPKTDFNELFRNISNNLEVHFNVTIKNIDTDKTTITDSSGATIQGDIIISTLSLDTLFQYKFGELEYRGYLIEPKIINQEYFHLQNPDSKKHYSMVYYPEPNVPYTRTTEYKCFNHKAGDEAYHGRTIITVETPSKSAKFYPFMDKTNENKFSQYIKHLANYPNLVSLGRLGLYKYTTLDTTTQQVFRFIEKFASWKMYNAEERLNNYHYIRGSWNN